MKKTFLPGFLRIPFFPVFSRGILSQERGFGEAAGIPGFSAVTGIFRRNSYGTGIPVYTPESSRFRRIPVAAKNCWLRPATK
jgi:hypothetical protein